jgi:NhaA family Na+:H+ antiporter
LTQPPASRLDLPVDVSIDHVLGEDSADLTLVEYGSFACPYCHAAHEVIANLRDRFGARMRYVYRHRPITGSNEALEAAVFAEAASAASGDYWTLHDRLMKRGPALRIDELPAIARALKVPPPAPTPQWREAEARVARDRRSAQASGALVSPTFFINNRRYEGAWDEATLAEAMLRSPGHRVQAAALDFARWAPSTGLLLLLMSLLAVALANSAIGPRFEAWWQMPVGFQVGPMADRGASGAGPSTGFMLPLRDWINDGLLSFFFLVVGLEIKREFTVGRLAGRKAAALPIVASVGGMIAPALLYLLLVPPGPLVHGWAVPTTTDTAFAIALIAVLGDRVPVALRVFLTAVVVVDDLAAIVVVALFYSGHLSPAWIAVAAAIVAALALLNRGGVYRPLPYGIGGVALWAALHASGLHATLAGVVVALVTPTRPPANLPALVAQAEAIIAAEMKSARTAVLRHGPSEPALRALDAVHDRIESPADKLLRSVEPWASYAVLPLFALANAGVAIAPAVVGTHGPLIVAIVAGLVGGKLLGILGGAALAVRAGLATKPDDYSWRQLAGAAAMAGIGFTMSLYIAAKAFPAAEDFAAAKIAVFTASAVAAVVGTALLWRRREAAAG